MRLSWGQRDKKERNEGHKSYDFFVNAILSASFDLLRKSRYFRATDIWIMRYSVLYEVWTDVKGNKNSPSYNCTKKTDIHHIPYSTRMLSHYLRTLNEASLCLIIPCGHRDGIHKTHVVDKCKGRISLIPSNLNILSLDCNTRKQAL